MPTLLYSAYGTRQISTIYTPNNEYYVIIELLPEYQNNPDKLSLLYVHSSAGKLIPLDTVAKLVPSVGPLTVNHLGQLPAATISFNLKPGTALGDATKLVEQEARSSATRRYPTHLPGNGASFPEFVYRHGIAAAGEPSS